MKRLEDENSKLSKLVAQMCSEWDASIRRACRVLEFDTSTDHYKSRHGDQAGIAARNKDICAKRVRYGYRRVHVMLKREGWDVNMKRIYRIYRDLALQLRNKTPKRRVKAKLREDRAAAVGPNDVWAMDFVYDQLATGKKLRMLTVVDTFSRYVPVLDPRFSCRGEDVVRRLEQVCFQIGYPKTIRVDQGSEFISRDLDLWAYANGVTLDFSRPGKPTQSRRSIPSALPARRCEKDRKLHLPAIQRMGSDHVSGGLISKRGQFREQVSPNARRNGHRPMVCQH